MFQLNHQLGGSMPNCAANSACSSRRSSRASSAVPSLATHSDRGTTGQYGSSPSSRRSSAGSRPGSRRESFLTPQDSSDSMGTPANYLALNSAAESNAESPMSAGQSLLQSIGAGVVGAASTFSTVTPPRYRKPFLLRPYQHF